MTIKELFDSWYSQLLAAAEKAEDFTGKPFTKDLINFCSKSKRNQHGVLCSFDLLTPPANLGASNIERFIDFCIHAEAEMGTDICKIKGFTIKKPFAVTKDFSTDICVLCSIGQEWDTKWLLFRFTPAGWVETGCDYSTAIIVEQFLNGN